MLHTFIWILCDRYSHSDMKLNLQTIRKKSRWSLYVYSVSVVNVDRAPCVNSYRFFVSFEERRILTLDMLYDFNWLFCLA